MEGREDYTTGQDERLCVHCKEWIGPNEFHACSSSVNMPDNILYQPAPSVTSPDLRRVATALERIAAALEYLAEKMA